MDLRRPTARSRYSPLRCEYLRPSPTRSGKVSPPKGGLRVFVGAVLTATLAACAAPAAPAATLTSEPIATAATATHTVEPTATATMLPTATETPTPTATETPTDTPVPTETDTVAPTATNTKVGPTRVPATATETSTAVVTETPTLLDCDFIASSISDFEGGCMVWVRATEDFSAGGFSIKKGECKLVATWFLNQENLWGIMPRDPSCKG